MGHDGNIFLVLVTAWIIGRIVLRNMIRGALTIVEIVIGLIAIVVALYFFTGGKAFDGKIDRGIIYQGQSP